MKFRSPPVNFAGRGSEVHSITAMSRQVYGLMRNASTNASLMCFAPYEDR